MKYKITDNQLESVIFLYLDNQDFIKIEKNDRIYFVNSEDDNHYQIRYNKENKMCFMSKELIGEVSSFFSLKDTECEKIIGQWTQNTLQMEVYNTWFIADTHFRYS
jgi:hypothetical protein